IFFVTFFGGALAAFGHLESHQRHSILCIKVKAKSASEHESFFYRHFLAGGINPLDPTNPLDNLPPSRMKRLSSGLGTLHDKFTFKVWIIGSYFVYILVIIFGVSRLEQEMHPDRVSFQESTFSYFQYYDEYFIQKPSFVQIVFSDKLKYSSPGVREKILDLHRSLEGLPFVEKEHTTSWIRDYYNEITSSPSLKAYLQSERLFINYVKKDSLTQKNRTFEDCHDMLTLVKKFREINFWHSNETRKILNLFHNFPCNGQDFLSTFVPQEYLKRGKEFVKLLDTLLWVNHYINKASSIYEMDVNLSETSKSIDCTRFLIVINNASDFQVQNTLRKTVERSGISGAQVFNYPAFIIEQVQLVEFTTIISTISTTIIVLLISFVLIPNIICSIWVAFSIVSIELGVIGIMALWNVKLNAISMVNLIMCVGFSVDFSAHFSYAYVRANGVDSKDWTREALNSVGHPIILAGLSTIVGILPICFTDSDIFIIFFKIVLLVIILGVLHSLIYLPLFMRLFGPQSFGRYDLQKGVSSKIVREAYQLRCCSGSFRLTRPTNPVNQCSENCDICFKHIRSEVIPSKGVFYINCKPNNGEQRSICEACESYYLDDSDAASLQPECEESLSRKCKKECSGRGASQLDRNSVVTSSDSAIELDFIESEKNVIIAPLDVKLL
ncbi:UNVERIFIED_CONTAM: hypothetical protein GTU68_036086, partial [Idotea baltica]|nr:hypothetical protein [Idotea baltica]